jgi:hypothetical protein
MTLEKALAVQAWYGRFDALDTPEQVALLKAAREIIREHAEQALTRRIK